MRWLYEVVVNLAANGLQRGLEAGISGEDQRQTLGLRAAHCTHNCEAIARTADIQVRDEHIKLARLNRGQSLRHAGGNLHVVAVSAQNFR